MPGWSDLESLKQARFPIVYLDGPTLGRSFMMHAVVVAEMNGMVRVLDPSCGEVDIPQDQFRDAWETAGSYAVILHRKGPESKT